MNNYGNQSSDKGLNKFFWVLLTIIFSLLLIHAGLRINIHFHPETYSRILFQRFNLDSEANIPTWFSTIELFIISVLAFMIYLAQKTSGEKGFHLFIWLIFASFYLFMSLDEAAQIHEIIDRQVQIKWVFFYAPFAGLFFAALSVYFIKEKTFRPADKKLIIFGIILFGLGALVAEFLEYLLNPSRLVEQIEILFEEGLEMYGSALVILGLLKIVNDGLKEKLTNTFLA